MKHERFADQVVKAFKTGQGTPRARREATYYLFRKYLGMNPEEVDQLSAERAEAWLKTMHEEEKIEFRRHTEVIETLAKLGGMKVKQRKYE